MNSKERVIRTLRHQNPDRIPLDLWHLPATLMKYEKELPALLERHPTDFAGADRNDPMSDPRIFTRGTHVDPWGVTFLNLQEGIHPEAKTYPLADWSAMAHYRVDLGVLDKGWEGTARSVEARQNQFVNVGGMNPWERMQFIRGTEALYIDLIDQPSEFFALRDMIFEYYIELARRWVRYDVDAISISDDWGSQRALLIPPRLWRSLFRPCYQEIINVAKAAGKFVFFHSDGYILEIYEDFVEMGVDALNSQIWCMGVDRVAPWAGRITFWGEISRQETLPHGTPTDIHAAARVMIEHLWRDGGLIGQGEAGPDVPLENIEALLTAWQV